MNFLYWNTKGARVERLVAELATAHDIDVVILSEWAASAVPLLTALNKTGAAQYRLPYSPVRDPVILVRLPRDSVKIVRDGAGVSVRRLAPPLGPDLTLVTVHLPSKLHQQTEDQILLATRIARTIDNEERRVGHRRTVVVGDFNMNPFEHGVVGAEGFHAMMSRHTAARGSRVVGGEERFFFYNPMWSHFGDYPDGPPATYFYDTSTQVNYYWNMFDQVLIRPELLPYFRDDTVAIHTSAGATDLLGISGRPSQRVASDHLPITFGLDLLKGDQHEC